MSQKKVTLIRGASDTVLGIRFLKNEPQIVDEKVAVICAADIDTVTVEGEKEERARYRVEDVASRESSSSGDDVQHVAPKPAAAPAPARRVPGQPPARGAGAPPRRTPVQQ